MNYADEWRAAYYQENNKEPSPFSMKLARHNDKVGTILRNRGISDAREGRDPLPGTEFFKLAKRVFRPIPDIPFDFLLTVADAWKEDYLEGYQKGGANDGRL